METLSAPNRKELRNFGLVLGTALALICGVGLPWLADSAFPLWPWLAAASLAVLALTVPAAMKPIYVGWMRIAQVLNWIISRATLALVYYGIVVPMGIAMRLLKKDPLRRRFEREAATYRVATPAADRKHLERPF